MIPLETSLLNLDWGLHKYGVGLKINPVDWHIGDSFSLDIETDEKDGCVGFACYSGSGEVFYFTPEFLTQTYIKTALLNGNLCGHNLKGDMQWLKGWGVNVNATNLHYDTMIASFVRDSSRQSHSLKLVAQDLLGYSWPTYKDIVGVGKKRLTLDKQPVELVANYCGMDCFATWKLMEYFNRNMTQNQKRIFNLEMDVNRILFEAECEGVFMDEAKLLSLKYKYEGEREEIKRHLQTLVQPQ